MSVTSTHDQLETWVEILTIAIPAVAAVMGYTVRGWAKAAELERDGLSKEMMRLSDSQETQWAKIDAIKEEAAKRDEVEEYKHRVQEIERTMVNRAELKEIITNAIESALAVALAPFIATLKTLPCQTGTICKMSHKGD